MDPDEGNGSEMPCITRTDFLISDKVDQCLIINDIIIECLELDHSNALSELSGQNSSSSALTSRAVADTRRVF